jgi:hypothetical protein
VICCSGDLNAILITRRQGLSFGIGDLRQEILELIFPVRFGTLHRQIKGGERLLSFPAQPPYGLFCRNAYLLASVTGTVWLPFDSKIACRAKAGS